MHLSRLEALQQLCQTNQIDGFLVPATDEFQNEYVPACWQRRTWLSGFDGSAGDLLVLKDHIILWTDGRYTLQASQQLHDLPITIIEQQQSLTQEACQWLTQLNQPLKIGIDPKTISIANATLLTDCLENIGGELIPSDNLVDTLWQDQPAVPNTLAKEWQGLPTITPAAEKIQTIQQQLTKQHVDAFIINTLDDIAWLLNIRGNDTPYTPVCMSYVVIEPAQCTWFVDSSKITAELQGYLQQQNIETETVDALPISLQNFTGTMACDIQQLSWWADLCLTNATLKPIKNPITLQKACKTPAEIAGMAAAHIQDAIALIEFMMWLENHWPQGITEYQAAQHLDQLRSHIANNKGLSFPTISGFADNGAVIHYRVSEKTAKTIDDSSLYLVDSGGQYTNGTTDVTRVMHFGTPTQQQIDDYTHALQGHIDLAKVIFPQGTTGIALDALARQYLWQQQTNFAHGTGHGVGCHLNVHEGPCSISTRGQVALQPGMVLSNEPGIYRNGQYGIRIENLQAVQPSTHNDFGDFLQFQTLTLVPYAKKLINTALLTPAQLQWIDHYHQQVYATLHPLCHDALRDWLREATAPLQ